MRAQGQPRGKGDGWVWVQWGVGSSGNTMQYTVITICSDSKRHRQGRRSAQEVAWIWMQQNRKRYFSEGHKLECGQVEWTPGHGNGGLGLLFNGDAILERAVPDKVLLTLTLKHFFTLHFELEWGLSTRYWMTIAIQYRALLGLPTTTAGSFAHET